MPSTFEFMNNPIIPSQHPAVNDPLNPLQTQQRVQNNLSKMQPVKTPVYKDPDPDDVVVGGFSFTVKDDKDTSSNLPTPLESDRTGHRGRPRKNEETQVVIQDTSGIIRADGTVESTPTMYTYGETTNLIRTTIGQIDMLSSEIKDELDNVRLNRTLKRKHDYIIGLSGNLSTLMGTKISAIRELNNSISKSNDMDYRKDKDKRVAESGVDDDQYIMNMYKSFISNPMQNVNNISALGPTSFDASVNNPNSGIIRAPLQNAPVGSQPADAGFLNYVSNMSPEQNMMRYESNPNVKQVVVFDAATGNKFFQVMDVFTGQVVPNVPVRDQMFMEDTTIDLKNKIAKNINLNESYPLIVINENITNEY